jgi:hypothetical protein
MFEFALPVRGGAPLHIDAKELHTILVANFEGVQRQLVPSLRGYCFADDAV